MIYFSKQQKVKVHQIFMRFTIAEPTNRRSVQQYTRTIENAFGKLTIKSTQKLIARDLKVFIALATYIYAHMDSVEVVANKKNLYSVTIDLYDFVKDFMHRRPSANIYNAVIDSLTALSQTRIEGEYIMKDADNIEKVQVKTSILPYLEIRSKREKAKRGSEKITIDLFIFEWILRMFSNPLPKSLIVDNYILQQTNSSVATLLALFLMSQSRATSYSKSFLVEQLQLHALKENDNIDRELKKAFSELQEIGYIQSWHIEKRADDTYYVFSRTTTALPKPKKK